MKKFLIALALGLSTLYAQEPSPERIPVSIPEQSPAQPLEWAAYGTWCLGMGALFTGFVYDGKGARSRRDALDLYNSAEAGETPFDKERYQALRADLSDYRSYRNAWVGVGSGLLVVAGALYAYSIYLNHEWQLRLGPGQVSLTVPIGGK